MNSRPDFITTQRNKLNQLRFLNELETTRRYLKAFQPSYGIVQLYRKCICPRVDERPLSYIKRCYAEATNTTFDPAPIDFANNLYSLLSKMEDHLEGTEELEVEKDLYHFTFISPDKTSQFFELCPSERAFSLYAQYIPFQDEQLLQRALSAIEMKFLRQYSTERIYEAVSYNSYLTDETISTLKTLAPLTAMIQSVEDAANIMADPLVSLTNQAPTVFYGNSLLETLQSYLTKLDDEVWNNFSSVIEIHHVEHDEFSRRKRRLSSAIRNLQRTVSQLDGNDWLQAMQVIGLTETTELIKLLRKTLMPESDFGTCDQYNLITKSEDILKVLTAIHDRYLYWLLNEAVDEPLAYFVESICPKD